MPEEWRYGYAELVENVTDFAIFLIGIDGTVLTWNAGAERIKGYRAEEIVGQNFSRFYPAAEASQGFPGKALKVAAASGRTKDEGWRVRKDGSEFWARVVITALRDKAGRLFGYLKIVRDLTDHKIAEDKLRSANEALAQRTAELELANAELQTFTYSVSHDLRGPLTRIEGFSAAVIEDSAATLNAEGRRRLDRIRSNALRLRILVDRLLELSRAEQGKIELSNVNVESLARVVCEEALRGLSARQVDFRIGKLPAIKASNVLLRQVLSNLVSNAVKYTGQRKHAVIEITGQQEGSIVHFVVKDNGIGFDMRNAGKLFAVFERLHSSREFPGTGLGLAIVRRIVRRHGGRVWAEGLPGKGASFHFCLPAGKG